MHDIRPFLPRLFSDPGSLLYIGARPDAHAWLPELYEAGHTITVLEIWPENIEGLRDDSRISRLIEGDARQASQIPDNFDYIFWWHGPEHLEMEEMRQVLTVLEQKAAKLIALACPWGYYPQGAHKGNIHETHLNYLYPSDFKELGYRVRTDGGADWAGSEIVAWKELDKNRQG